MSVQAAGVDGFTRWSLDAWPMVLLSTHFGAPFGFYVGLVLLELQRRHIDSGSVEGSRPG